MKEDHHNFTAKGRSITKAEMRESPIHIEISNRSNQTNGETHMVKITIKTTEMCQGHNSKTFREVAIMVKSQPI